MLDAILQLTASTLDAALSDEPRVDAVESSERQSRRERRKSRRRGEPEEAPQGRWWTKTVPNTKPYVPFVLDYCRDLKIAVAVNGRRAWSGDVQAITPRADKLALTYSQSWMDGPQVIRDVALAYPGGPTGQFASLCQGKPTRFGKRIIAQISPANLLFEKRSEGETAVIEWQDLSIKYDGPWIFDFAAQVRQIEIGPESAEVVIEGWKNILLPRIQWAD
jgi:hypothetical protein